MQKGMMNPVEARSGRYDCMHPFGHVCPGRIRNGAPSMTADAADL